MSDARQSPQAKSRYSDKALWPNSDDIANPRQDVFAQPEVDGDSIPLAIELGLESSRTLVLVMSQAAFDSEWVTLERQTALFRDPTNQQRRFIAVRLDDCDITGLAGAILACGVKRFRAGRSIVCRCVRCG